MLPSSKRLSTILFKETIKKGLVFNTPITLAYVQNGSNIGRFSVSVPKKVAKTAVLRNKIRRRIYSIIKVLDSRTTPFKQVVFIMKNGSEKMSFIDLKEEMKKVFVKIGLLK